MEQNTSEIIERNIKEYEKQKLMLYMDLNEHTDIQLEFLTETLWDKIHDEVDKILPKMSIDERAEIHFKIEETLINRGLDALCDYYGLWFYEEYHYEIPEEKYHKFFKRPVSIEELGL